MTRSHSTLFTLSLLLALATTGAALGQSPPTVWHHLGIPQGWQRWRDATANRRGNRPGLERKPPLKALADPANLKSDIPAIKAAAEIKTQEDLRQQKIKALKYLAQVGCGCYGGVAEALAAALEDCTEEVRLEAAMAIDQAVSCRCDVCQKTCCTKELAAKMYERAYERDADGCFLEPSERVRAALETAIASCPPDMRDIGINVDPVLRSPEDQPPMPMPLRPEDRPPGAGLQGLPPLEIDPTVGLPAGEPSSRRNRQSPPAASAPNSAALGARQADFERMTPAVPTVPQDVCGEVIEGRSPRGFVRIVFHNNQRPPVGTELEVYHSYLLGAELAGTLVIRDYEGHHAIAAARTWDKVKVSRGDSVECTIQVPAEPAAAATDIAPVVSSAEGTPTPARPRTDKVSSAGNQSPIKAVERIFTLSPSKAESKTPAAAAAARPAPVTRPAPVVVAPPRKSGRVIPASAVAPEKPAASAAVTEMLRLPPVHVAPPGKPTMNQLPPIVLPGDKETKTERLPPVVPSPRVASR
jgi:hypothetical protein